jgi:hypothetical protein
MQDSVDYFTGSLGPVAGEGDAMSAGSDVAELREMSRVG